MVYSFSLKTTTPFGVTHKGWLCNLCDGYGLGDNCVNSGVLMWRRSRGARFVLQEWWKSQFNDRTQNFHLEGKNVSFHGWGEEEKGRDHMSEQNRLMYVTGTIPRVNEAVLIGPVAPAWRGATSCPERVDWPCLQVDSVSGESGFVHISCHHFAPNLICTPIEILWRDDDAEQCFVRHMPDNKSHMIDISENILSGQLRAQPSPESLVHHGRSGRLGGGRME